MKGPLTTNELLKQRKLIIKKFQLQYSDTETFKINQKQLNVQVSEEGLYQCFGRVQVSTSYLYPQRVSSSRNISRRSSHLNHPKGSDINNG